MISRNSEPIKMRNYGRIIQDMIRVAQLEPDKASREKLTIYIAQCMRQRNMVWNKDQEIGTQRIKDDIRTLSNGGLSTDFAGFDEAMSMQQRRQDFNNRNDRNNRHDNKPNQQKQQPKPQPQPQPAPQPEKPEKPAEAPVPAPKKRGRKKKEVNRN